MWLHKEPYGSPGNSDAAGGTYCDHVVIDHDSATPLYLQLADLLRTQIQSERLVGRLPSLKTLSQEHQVSHITAEKALAVLKDEGLVQAVIGKGYYTTGPK
jgi:DNA-binding GntR family transcriptional regulator